MALWVMRDKIALKKKSQKQLNPKAPSHYLDQAF